MRLPQPATAPDEPRWCVDEAVLHWLEGVSQLDELARGDLGIGEGMVGDEFHAVNPESAVDRTSDTTGNSAMDPSRSEAYAEVDEPALSSWDTAVTSCAGANGLFSRMLFGTPSAAQSSAAAPVM